MGNSMSTVALPAVMTEFEVSLNSGVWVVNLCVLTFAILMPVCGYLGDLYGQRRLYLGSMVLYITSSIIARLSPNLPWLIGARVLQGISVAPILPVVMAIIAHTFAADQRGRPMGKPDRRLRVVGLAPGQEYGYCRKLDEEYQILRRKSAAIMQIRPETNRRSPLQKAADHG